jgi:hypothetical protein
VHIVAVLIIFQIPPVFSKRKKGVHQKNSEKAIVMTARYLSDSLFFKILSFRYLKKHPGSMAGMELMGYFLYLVFHPNMVTPFSY